MPRFVEREFRAYPACGLLEHGFVRTVFASLRRRDRQQWSIDRAQCGAVTVVQRLGDALNANVHFHSLVLDGVYARGPDGPLRFHPLPPPENVEIERVPRQAPRRIARILERLSRMADARLLYRLRHRWRDGTTHVAFEPQELVERLAALVPPPRFHLVRYHGILGPFANERDRVVPGAGTAQEQARPPKGNSALDPPAEPPRGAEVRGYGTGAIPGRYSPPIQSAPAGCRVISAPAGLDGPVPASGDSEGPARRGAA